MAKLNLLIGNGEVLTTIIPPRKLGPDNKAYPYSIEKTRERLAPKLERVIKELAELPPDARPDGDGVTLITVHPAFLAKSYTPVRVLRAAGLRMVGSRQVQIKPEFDARKDIGEEPQPAASLYIAGAIDAFRSLLDLLMHSTITSHQKELRRIEDIATLTSLDRIGAIPSQGNDLKLEAVIHSEDRNLNVLNAFEKYIKSCHGETRLDKTFKCRGLTFLPVRIPRAYLGEFAKFSLLRTVRAQPIFRTHKPRNPETSTRTVPNLPNEDAISNTLVTGLFDGGLSTTDFSLWVDERICEGLEDGDAEHQLHGTAVTSAFLFGRVENGETELSRPFTKVDHYRVVGPRDSLEWFNLYEPLKRIKAALQAKRYDFVGLSIGPEIEIDDGHAHPWTSMLDEYIYSSDAFVVTAAGNVPSDAPTCIRIQPPADAVNALSVGAANSDGLLWDQHHTSCMGPGRSPGRIKPDGIAFAGTTTDPIYLHGGSHGLLEISGGTSFAAPLTLRMGAGIKTITNHPLSSTSLRALLIHHAERGLLHDVERVGWGRFPQTVEQILLNAENEATIIYQGSIESGHPVRVRIPLPDGITRGKIAIKATFCFTSAVDPAHTINYTRSGLGITFRPRLDEVETLPFFSSSNIFSPESDLRKDAHKWETVLSRTQQFPALRLSNPIFEIYYQTRQQGFVMPKREQKPLPYVLLVTVSVDHSAKIYDRILQKYPALTAIKLTQSIQLRTER